jgi:hypothetical protein
VVHGGPRGGADDAPRLVYKFNQVFVRINDSSSHAAA